MNDEAKKTGQGNVPSTGFWQKLFRRRHYLIDKKLQLHFSILLIMIGGINAIFFGFIFYFFSQHTAVMYKPLLIPSAIPDNIMLAETNRLWATILICGMFECVLIILLGIFFSHRIAGPLYKIAKAFKEITTGRYPGLIKLRKDDLLKDFAEIANEMIVALKDRCNLK